MINTTILPGLLLGALMGAGLGLLGAAGGTLDTSFSPQAAWFWPRVIPFALLGMLLGTVWALSAGRAPRPRVGVIEVESRRYTPRRARGQESRRLESAE